MSSRPGKRTRSQSRAAMRHVRRSRTPSHETAEAEHWRTTRRGAWAARGFHYQEDVGVLFAARLLAGTSPSPVLVPEGFDDYSFEGGESEQVQVKSRQDSRGAFSVGAVAEFVVDAARKAAGLRTDGLPGRPVVVIERAMPDDIPWATGTRLGDAPIDHPLRAAVYLKARASGVAPDLCDEASVVIVPWLEARQQASGLVCDWYGITPQAADVVLRAFRNEVTQCINVNAHASAQERASLDRTSLTRIADEARSLMKVTGLEEAVTTGVCEAIDVHTPLVDTRFYEGVNAQPGHIAAGLAVPRPELQSQVARALDEGSTVLISGPSGIGKSVLLWLSVSDLSHVLWFRIHKLREQDVPAIVRLIRAYNPSLDSPIGLAVDGVGLGAIQAWDALHEEIVALPGARLIGTARFEDLPQIRSLAQCTVVEPDLDEELAERIFAELSATNATTQTHWRPAFSSAGGLTLEYTHLLTRGRRLSETIEDQVRARRADASRDLELKVIALVSVGHQWGTELDVRSVAKCLGVSDGEIARALSRLIEEHILCQDGSILTGVHQLRSAALARAVHAVPPPILSETIRTVLGIVEDDHLGRILAGALHHHPDLEAIVLQQAQCELERRGSVTAWSSMMQALRVLDFQQLASGWPNRLSTIGIPPAGWSLAVQAAITISHVMGNREEKISAAIDAIRSDLAGPSPLRDEFIAGCSAETIARIITTKASNATEAIRALAVLQGTTPLSIESWISKLVDDSPLAHVLMKSATHQLGEVLETARSVSATLSLILFGAAGGKESVFERFHSEHPGLITVDVAHLGSENVALAELAQPSSDSDQEIGAYTGAFVSDLLRCFPMCDVTDVRFIGPGQIPIDVAPGAPLVKRWRREHVYPLTQVAWNRVRVDTFARIGQVPNPSHHAGETLAIVEDLAEYLDAVVHSWCIGKASKAQVRSMEERRHALIRRARLLRAPITLPANDSSRSVDDAAMHPINDPIHALTEGVVATMTTQLFKNDPDWVALAEYVSDQIRPALRKVRLEPWELVGATEPAALAAMESILFDLHCVLMELGAGALSRRSIAAITQNAKLGGLARVACAVNDERNSAIRTWIESIETRAHTAGHRVTVLSREHDTSQPERVPIQIAVSIQVDEFDKWFEAVQELPAIVNGHPVARETSAPILLVPMFGGRPLRRLALQLRQNLRPGHSLFDSWADRFPRAWPTPIADALSSAYDAAVEISEVAGLVARRPSHPTDESRLDRARGDLNKTLDLLHAQGLAHDDFAPVAEELERIAAVVELELLSPGTEAPTFSAEFAAGRAGEHNETFDCYTKTALVALAAELLVAIE